MMNGAINGKMLNVRLNAGAVEVEQIPGGDVPEVPRRLRHRRAA